MRLQIPKLFKNYFWIFMSLSLILWANGCKKETAVKNPNPTVVIYSSMVFDNLSNSVLVTAEVKDEGESSVFQRGIAWASHPGVTTLDTFSLNGPGKGIFQTKIIFPKVTKTYYFRAFATNTKGTSYSEEVSYTLGSVIPIVNTLAPSDINDNSVALHGESFQIQGFTASIDERGFLIDTLENLDYNNVSTRFISNTQPMSKTSFVANPFNLVPGKKYFVKAYVKTISGIGYGSQVNFTTSNTAISPVVSLNGGEKNINKPFFRDTMFLSITATAKPGRTIQKIEITRQYKTHSPVLIYTQTFNQNQVNLNEMDLLHSLNLEDQDRFVYNVKAYDDQNNSGSASETLNIFATINSSSIIYVGPENHPAFPHFLGVPNNVFTSFNNGPNPIDFVYFQSNYSYDHSLYSPDYYKNPNESCCYAPEIRTWPHIRKTQIIDVTSKGYKFPQMTPKDLFNLLQSVDFSSSINDGKVLISSTGQMIAFRTEEGKTGVILLADVRPIMSYPNDYFTAGFAMKILLGY